MSVPRAIHQSLQVPVAGVLLEAALGVPRESTRGAALFAHGSGSGRHSSRNRHVADELNRSGFVTVLADWAADSPRTGIGVGLFGASTGAAAALIAAANRPNACPSSPAADAPTLPRLVPPPLPAAPPR